MDYSLQDASWQARYEPSPWPHYEPSSSSALAIEPDNTSHEHPLLKSVRNNDQDLVRSTLVNGQNSINQLYPCGAGTLAGRSVTPFHLAVNLQNIEMAQFLLDQGADINSKMSGNQTPLIVCISSRDVRMLDFLLAKGADINDDSFPLHWACKKGWTDGINQLLKLPKCNSTIKDNNGLAPIHYAGRLSIQPATTIVERLVKHDRGNVNLQSKPEGCTPLHQATAHKNTDLIKFLRESGANSDTRGRVTNRLMFSHFHRDDKDKIAYPIDKGDFCRYFCCCIVLPFRLCCGDCLEEISDYEELCLKDTLCPCCKPTPLDIAYNEEIQLLLKQPESVANPMRDHNTDIALNSGVVLRPAEFDMSYIPKSTDTHDLQRFQTYQVLEDAVVAPPPSYNSLF